MLGAMFSEHLFSHRYDVDDLIAALCGTQPLWLNTQSGTFSAQRPQTAPDKNLFLLEPLPPVFLAELATHAEAANLDAEDRNRLAQLIQTATVQKLAPQLNQPTRLAGWLRERLKEAALEWLDTNNLIPPSMRHINRKTAAVGGTARSVAITGPEDA